MNIAIGLLADLLYFVRLVAFAVLDVLGAVIRPVLAGLGLIGFLMCGFYALVAPKSHFPQGTAMRGRPRPTSACATPATSLGCHASCASALPPPTSA